MNATSSFFSKSNHDNHGYFGKESMTWKIGQEAIVLLGGSRAILMQLAHPLVAAGVSAHSRYLTDPFGRALQTFMFGQWLTFGNTEATHKTARAINRLHAHVSGPLLHEAGRYNEGVEYRARDPELLLWVHATLIDTVLLTYSLFIGPLSYSEQEQYYQESKRMARLLGLCESAMPATVTDLRQYVQDMVNSDALAVTPEARRLARTVLFPPLPSVARPLLQLQLQLTNGLLPEPVRKIYDMRWNAHQQRLFDTSAKTLRAFWSHLPMPLRVLPITRRIMQE